jgi:hypothetical protein
MAKPKYNTVEEAVDAWKSGDLKLETLKKNYYHTQKLGQDRQYFYREAIYEIEKIRLKEQWG